MFTRLAKKEPEHFAVRQYQKFLLSAGKTRSSILISCGARLAPFDIREVRELMETDEMELDTLGDRKTALFLIMSETDTTYVRPDTCNIWLGGLVGMEYLLGARAEMLENENPLLDLMAGILRIHIYITQPSPMQLCEFTLEYDTSYVQPALAA